MNEKLVDSLVEIIRSLSEQERNLLNKKLAKFQTSKVHSENWQDQPFVGMWKSRQDLEDSNAWVRSIRHQHWTGNVEHTD